MPTISTPFLPPSRHPQRHPQRPRKRLKSAVFGRVFRHLSPLCGHGKTTKKRRKPLILKAFWRFKLMIPPNFRDQEAASSSLATPTIKKPEISMVSGFFLFLETALTTPDTPKTPPTLSILLKNAGQVLHRTAARIAAFRACAAFLLLACPNWTRLFCCGFTLRAGQRRCCLRCLRGLRRADSRSPTRRT